MIGPFAAAEETFVKQSSAPVVGCVVAGKVSPYVVRMLFQATNVAATVLKMSLSNVGKGAIIAVHLNPSTPYGVAIGMPLNAARAMKARQIRHGTSSPSM